MPMHAFTLGQGDRFTHASAGGGGFGDPFERDPAAVLEDVLDGKVSIAAARDRYGVVVDRRRRYRRRGDPRAAAAPMSVDLAIRNGLVVDGTGSEGRAADVGIRDGRVVAVGEVPRRCTEIDAAGKVVTPGFIDIHSHSDFTLLVDPRAASAVHQGVTLEVVGNCGFGCFPLLDKELAPQGDLRHSARCRSTWTTAADYFERLEEARAGDQRAQPRAERPAPALGASGLADRPARRTS